MGGGAGSCCEMFSSGAVHPERKRERRIQLFPPASSQLQTLAVAGTAVVLVAISLSLPLLLRLSLPSPTPSPPMVDCRPQRGSQGQGIVSGGRRRKAEAREKEKEQERRENQPADGGRSARKRRAADSEKKRVRNLQEQYKQLSAVRVVERGSGHFSKVRTLGATIRRLEDLQQLGSSVS